MTPAADSAPSGGHRMKQFTVQSQTHFYSHTDTVQTQKLLRPTIIQQSASAKLNKVQRSARSSSPHRQKKELKTFRPEIKNKTQGNN